MGYSPPTDIDPQVRRLIRHKARRLVGCCGLSRFDRQDLEQELALHAISKQSHFNPTRGTTKAFYEQLLRRKAASIVRDATASKRDRHRIDQTFDVAKLPARDAADAGMQLDVRLALAGLPPELGAIATLFITYREAEVVRRTGLGRQRVRAIKQRIAGRLRAAGLSEEIIFSRRQPTGAASAYVEGSGHVVADDVRVFKPDVHPVAKRRARGPSPLTEDTPCGP